MIYEFALEPALVATWGKLSEYRYFFDKFGLGQPRIVSQYPKLKNWRRQVLMASSEIDGLEKERIIELIKRLSDVMVSRHGWSYDGNISWLENAEEEDERCPFHAILALSNPRTHRCVLSGPAVGGIPEPKWDLKNEVIVARNPDAMATVLAAMLRNCSEVIFIDPHFGPEEPRYRRPFKLFMESLVKNRASPLPNRVELHTSDKSSRSFFRSECEARLTGIVPTGINVVIKRWKQNESGQRLHNRYILTDIGGVRFGAGLDENRNDPDGDTDEVSLMNRETYLKRWTQYASEKPAFELAEQPITIVGKAK
jgi:hypothetical protein